LTTEPEAGEVAGAITPAPGGVGRMNHRHADANTLEAARRAAGVTSKFNRV
jgi:5,10-methylene-tetrahydrofolate dehydrogenase/methenyl tetrahydrofolate cyclohydrolase